MNAADLRGAGRLAIDATLGLTALVENLHHNILRVPGVLGTHSQDKTRGLTGLVYRSIRGVTRLVGGSLDALLGQVQAFTQPGSGISSAERDAVIAALNGVLGDHLAASGNPLATPMRLRHDGQALALTQVALAAAVPQATGRVLVLVHGLCMNDRQWLRQGHDHGAALAASGGFTVLRLHYNTGRHIETNGAEFARLMQALMQAWPVPVQQLAVIGHSMGGLVARSACHQAQAAGMAWPGQLTELVFLGTPHHGAPLERGGRWVDAALGASPYTAAFARLGRLRSAGITDLRHGLPAGLPLSEGVACHAVAATLADNAGGLKDKLLGDGLVPVASALGQHKTAQRCLAFEPGRQLVVTRTGHLDLLSSAQVCTQLESWLGQHRQ